MDTRPPLPPQGAGSLTPNNPRVRTVGFSVSGGDAADVVVEDGGEEGGGVFQLDALVSSPAAPLPVIIPPAFQVRLSTCAAAACLGLC